MKKKGLIISTVVMAVVLIASLTTATYAWFSASASVSVDPMEIKVEAASDVVIGIKTSTSTGSDNDYINGTVNMGGVKNPTDAGNGLGTQLSVNFVDSTSISLSKAVGTTASFTEKTIPTLTTGFDPSGSNVIFTANSGTSGATQDAKDRTIDADSVVAAIPNTDYIYLPIGVRAAKDNVYGIKCTISITTKDGAANLKDNAALHFYIKNADGKTQEIDVFALFNKSTNKSAVTGTKTYEGTNDFIKSVKYTTTGTSVSVPGEATAEFSFVIVPFVTGTKLNYTDASAISNIEIYAYVYGDDLDCTSAGTGTSVAFNMSFAGCDSTGKWSDEVTA